MVDLEERQRKYEHILRDWTEMCDQNNALYEKNGALQREIDRLHDGLDAIDVEVRETIRCCGEGDIGMVASMLCEVRRVLDNTIAGHEDPWKGWEEKDE